MNFNDLKSCEEYLNCELQKALLDCITNNAPVFYNENGFKLLSDGVKYYVENHGNEIKEFWERMASDPSEFINFRDAFENDLLLKLNNWRK